MSDKVKVLVEGNGIKGVIECDKEKADFVQRHLLAITGASHVFGTEQFGEIEGEFQRYLIKAHYIWIGARARCGGAKQ